MLKRFLIITAILMTFAAVLYAGCTGRIVTFTPLPDKTICLYQCSDGLTFTIELPPGQRCPSSAFY